MGRRPLLDRAPAGAPYARQHAAYGELLPSCPPPPCLPRYTPFVFTGGPDYAGLAANLWASQQDPVWNCTDGRLTPAQRVGAARLVRRAGAWLPCRQAKAMW